ncbi:MAG TPA: protein kinase, partial [Blastocatellia bacterium]|nr:protein kinase [Blastocatellia bacterium]
MIGNVVGNYKITETLGEGGMGAVFKGVDLMLEREVAIKMLRPELSRQPQLVERFRSEAVTLAKLNHPNIATLHSFFRQSEDFFMVMEFVRGETLDSIITRSGAMPLGQAVSLFCQALEGIGQAHILGIVHRDIKPANMMLTDKGSIKVMDFGIARVLGTSRMTKQGMVVGTIEYMAPEQVQGLETDARSDIYSLGVLLYEMLTGRVPFSSENEFQVMKAQIEEAPTPPRTFAPHIPFGVERALMRALAKRPDARFQTVSEFRAAIEEGMGDAAILSEAKKAKAAPPPTRIGAAAPTGPAAEAVPRATRLAGNSVPTSPDAARQQDTLKETRLGFSAGDQAAYPASAYGQDQAIRPQASLLSKLTWVHYAGAAALVVVLMAVPLLLMGRGETQSAPQPSVVTQPAPQPVQSSPAAEAPVQSNAPNRQTVPPVAPPIAAQPIEGQEARDSGQRAGGNQGASKQKPGR